MAKDLLSGSDADFGTLLTNLLNGLPAPDPVLAAAVDAWREARAQAYAADAAAQAATAAKATARAAVTQLARQKIRQLQADPAVSDGQRAAMGLRVRDAKPTRVAPPAQAPELLVEASGRGQHTFTFRVGHRGGSALGYDGVTRRGKPKGMAGVEIFVMSPDAAPGSPLAAFAYLAFLTRSPRTLSLPAELAGKMAHYQARWRNTRGEVGPWSERIECTVLA